VQRRAAVAADTHSSTATVAGTAKRAERAVHTTARRVLQTATVERAHCKNRAAIPGWPASRSNEANQWCSPRGCLRSFVFGTAGISFRRVPRRPIACLTDCLHARGRWRRRCLDRSIPQTQWPGRCQTGEGGDEIIFLEKGPVPSFRFRASPTCPSERTTQTRSMQPPLSTTTYSPGWPPRRWALQSNQQKKKTKNDIV
jgi:hypothetical protein